MIPTVVRPAASPQLITTRKAGRPSKSRPLAEVSAVARKSPSQEGAPKAPVAHEGILYDADAVEGFKTNAWVPKGQYIDTYA